MALKILLLKNATYLENVFPSSTKLETGNRWCKNSFQNQFHSESKLLPTTLPGISETVHVIQIVSKVITLLFGNLLFKYLYYLFLGLTVLTNC